MFQILGQGRSYNRLSEFYVFTHQNYLKTLNYYKTANMASCVVLLLFLYGVCFQFFPSYGFLLTGNKSSNSMTDKHFTYVMGELGTDRLKLQQMEQFVLQLQSEMSSMKQELLNLKQSNGNGPSIGNAPSVEMSHLENVILNLKETMNKHLSTDKGLTQSNTQLQQEVLNLQQVTTNIQQTTAQLQNDNAQLQQDNSQLKQNNVHLEKENLLLKTEIDQTRNETLELKLKVNTLLGAVTQLQNNKTPSQDFNLLKTDIQVLNNGTEEIKHILDTLQKSVSMNISSLSKQMDRIYTTVNSVTITSNSCCQHIQGIFQQLHGYELAIKDLQNAIKQTENENQQINEALKKLSTAQNSTIQRINQVSQKGVYLINNTEFKMCCKLDIIKCIYYGNY